MASRNRPLIALLLLLLVAGAFVAGYGYGQGRTVAGGDADAQGLALLRDVLFKIRTTYLNKQVDTADLFHGAARGMFEALDDPYSRFMDADAYQEFRESELGGIFSGVGIFIELQNGRPVVVQPIPGTPAHRAGLRPGDRIMAVDGRSTERMSLEEVVSRIRGPVGTTVKLSVARAQRAFDVTLVRARIRNVTVQGEEFLDEALRRRLRAAQAGYLRILRFDEPTTRDFAAALNQVLAAGARGLLLDLRSNPGGLLEVAVSVADHFVPARQPIVITVDRDGRQEIHRATPGRKVNIPVVVLINEYTASGAEIIAGALKDHDIARLVGIPTFGKGVIQQILSLPGGTGGTLTSGRYLTPDGHDIHKKGITPSVVVGARLEGRTDAELRRIEADQLLRGLAVLVQQMARQ